MQQQHVKQEHIQPIETETASKPRTKSNSQ